MNKTFDRLEIGDIIMYYDSRCVVAKPMSVVVMGYNTIVTLELLDSINTMFWDGPEKTKWTGEYQFQGTGRIRNVNITEFPIHIPVLESRSSLSGTDVDTTIYLFPDISMLK